LEANNKAFQATPHKCDAPTNGFYSNCDRGGCSQNTRDSPNAYGPGRAYTIDTTKPFKVRTDFPAKAGVLQTMRTTLQQGDHKVVLDHSSCQSGYMAQMSDALAAGMSLRITYWGGSAEDMAWMDEPPCGPQACEGAHAGDAIIRDIKVSEAEDAPAAIADVPAPALSTEAPKPKYAWNTVSIDGFQDAVLAGSSGNSGSTDGTKLTVKYGHGTTLFSAFKDAWEPDSIAQLKLLGKAMSYTVDLSKVGCACNLAFYLISMPALGMDGSASRGTDRGGQPPYYCDANKVGGQWCPEVDIMEANN
jgi:hypothetical protein